MLSKIESASQKENWNAFRIRLGAFPEAARTKIDSSYDFAKTAHKKQKRISGEGFFEHLRRTSLILLDECHITKAPIICAALLHDTLEDTSIYGDPTKLTTFELIFSAIQKISDISYPESARIVLSLTESRVDGIEIKDKAQAKAIKYNRLRNASEEALLIKMADRLDNLRTFYPKEGEKTPKEEIRETEEILIPIFKNAAGKYPAETNYLLAEINKAIVVLKTKTFKRS